MILIDVPNAFWDQNFIDLIHGMQQQLGSGAFTVIAEQVAAILSLLYLSVKAYAMIVGEGKFEIMPLFRPFLITLVIVNFGLYAKIVASVGKAAESLEEQNFEAAAKHMDGVQYTKDSLYNALWVRVLDSSAQIRHVMTADQNASSDATIDMITGAMGAGGGVAGAGAQISGWFSKKAVHAVNAVESYVTLYEQLIFAKIAMWLQNLIEFIVMSIFKGVAYCMWFIQMFLMYILLTLGPLSFALSIVKPFRDSWIYWTQKYFSVSFYVAVAMIVLNMGLLIISYGIQQEISRIEQVLQIGSPEEFLNAILHFDNFLGYLIVALFVVIGGLMQVPKVCGWIIGAGGEALEGFHSQAGKWGKGAARTAAGTAGKMLGSK